MRGVESYKCLKCSPSALTQAHYRFATCFIALSTIHRSKSADKFTNQVCQVTTVVMETTQLVLRKFINF